MSDRWWLRLGDTQLQENRNDEPAKLLTVFQETDKYVDQRWIAAHATQTAFYSAQAVLDDGNDLLLVNDSSPDEAEVIAAERYAEEANTRTVFGYRASVGAVVQRLNLMGFTAAACRREMIGMLRFLHENRDPIELSVRDDNTGSCAFVSYDEVLERGLAASITQQNRQPGQPMPVASLDDACLNALNVFLDPYYDYDPRIVLAVQLDGTDPYELLELDLHDLYLAEYFTAEQPIAQIAIEHLAEAMATTGPIIVVTEGQTDAHYSGSHCR